MRALAHSYDSLGGMNDEGNDEGNYVTQEFQFVFSENDMSSAFCVNMALWSGSSSTSLLGTLNGVAVSKFSS